MDKYNKSELDIILTLKDDFFKHISIINEIVDKFNTNNQESENIKLLKNYNEEWIKNYKNWKMIAKKKISNECNFSKIIEDYEKNCDELNNDYMLLCQNHSNNEINKQIKKLELELKTLNDSVEIENI